MGKVFLGQASLRVKALFVAIFGLLLVLVVVCVFYFIKDDDSQDFVNTPESVSNLTVDERQIRTAIEISKKQPQPSAEVKRQAIEIAKSQPKLSQETIKKAIETARSIRKN